MPSSPKAKKALLESISPDTQGIIYELGSGWGSLAVPLAKRCPHAQVIAFETSPIPFAVSMLRQWFTPSANLRIIRRDFFTANLQDASVVVCYLYPDAMHALKQKFELELPAGCSIISNTFGIAGWQAVRTLDTHDLYHTKIYFYQIPVSYSK